MNMPTSMASVVAAMNDISPTQTKTNVMPRSSSRNRRIFDAPVDRIFLNIMTTSSSALFREFRLIGVLGGLDLGGRFVDRLLTLAIDFGLARRGFGRLFRRFGISFGLLARRFRVAFGLLARGLLIAL